MKICILGAAGRTGIEVVNCARVCGFEVTACVYRDGSNLSFPNDVAVKKGDIMDYGSVLEAVRGSDAVISVLGHIKGSDPFMQTKGMVNLAKAKLTSRKKAARVPVDLVNNKEYIGKLPIISG